MSVITFDEISGSQTLHVDAPQCGEVFVSFQMLQLLGAAGPQWTRR